MTEELSFQHIEEDSNENDQIKLLESWYNDEPGLRADIDGLLDETTSNEEFFNRLESLTAKYPRKPLQGTYETAYFSLSNGRNVRIKRDEQGTFSFGGGVPSTEQSK